jgi:Domain of unknown function (DUF6378)
VNENPTPRLAYHQEILNDALSSITDKMVDYGEPVATFERASAILSLILGKPVTPYEIAMAKFAIKLARIAHTPDHRKSYIELIANAAFAGEFINAGEITVKRMAQAMKPRTPSTSAPLFERFGVENPKLEDIGR